MNTTLKAIRRCMSVGALALTILHSAAETATASPCGEPDLERGGPASVVIVMDGIHSSLPEAGSFYPLPVSEPAPGVPTVRDYCPISRSGTRRAFPPGLRQAMSRWVLRGVSSEPFASSPCGPEGGFGTRACLFGKLASLGSVVLPYSYNGAELVKAPEGVRFDFPGHVGKAATDPADDDTEQPAVELAAQLDSMIDSIVAAWPRTRIFVLAHSWAGVVAETWWEAEQLAGSRPPQVEQVITLDSPINGIPRCLPSAAILGLAPALELCRRWSERDALDARIIELAADGSFFAFGVHGDPSYTGGATLAGDGNLRPQVVYSCPDDGTDPASVCIDASTSYVAPRPQCDGAGPGVFGTTGHFVVHACPAVNRRIIAAVRDG